MSTVVLGGVLGAALRARIDEREDGRLTIKRMRIAELEEENEMLRMKIRTLEADIVELKQRT